MKKIRFIISMLVITISMTAFCNCTLSEGGYLGNLNTTSGNCKTHDLPPLCAFGSLSINQNAPLNQNNRLNPKQLPTTNNFQNFQHPCSVFDTVWTEDTKTAGNLSQGAGAVRVRTGPFLVGMTRTGPVVTIPQYNMNVNKTLPNLVVDSRITIFFGASETSNTYFDVSSDVVNSETCLINYTPKGGKAGSVIDYNIMGTLFHDVYYDNLTPIVGSSVSSVVNSDGKSIPLSIDGGPVQSVAFGQKVKGKSFQFFLLRASPLEPATMLLFAEDANSDDIEFTVVNSAPGLFLFTASKPYTGFLRLAAISANDPVPAIGSNYQQKTFYMPENTPDPNDTSNPPASCAVEDPSCSTNVVQSQSWWKTAEVDAIAPTGLSFYLLFSKPWTKLFTQLTEKNVGPNWTPPGGSIKIPVPPAMSIMLPVLALENPTLAKTYYADYVKGTNPNAPPYNYNGDFTTDYFLLRFDMMMAENLSADIASFQSTNRQLPDYQISATPNPVNNVEVYRQHSRYIPVKAEISYTGNTVSWTYTLSSKVKPTNNQNKVLVCFPFWKYLQGTQAGKINTTPAIGEPLQNFIYNDTIKGTFYAAEALNGKVTFLEGNAPSWFGPSDLFIPQKLQFTSAQLQELENILNNVIAKQVEPKPPYFPESYLDAPYNAGKTVYYLAKSALWIAYFLEKNGQSSSIVKITKPYIDNAKSVLTQYFINRTPGSCFFVADTTAGGICVNGAGGNGTYAKGPNLQQSADSGVNFGNYVYNDHHFFYGYFLLSVAMLTEWELKYNGGSNLWINLPVLGADGLKYSVRDFVDFLWRDIHNPFTNDPDLPYNRHGLPWEGHSVANGMQYNPSQLGRNQESISEDFNSWLGVNTYAQVLLKTNLSKNLQTRYQTLRDFSLMNLKMVASSASVQWYKNPKYWKRVAGGTPDGSSLLPSIYIGQFSMTTVTNGQVNDTSAQNQTFF